MSGGAFFDLASDRFKNKDDSSLAGTFVVPPFSILDTRQGYWQDRKRAWTALGIQSELGRTRGGANKQSKMALELAGGFDKHPSHKKLFDSERKVCPGGSPRPAMDYSKGERGDGAGKPMHKADWGYVKGETDKEAKGVLSAISAGTSPEMKERFSKSGIGASIFDPVLCELAYRWWCVKGGKVLDPFSGGSVRGIVAAKLGLKYTGIDLSEPQVHANKIQGQAIVPENMPDWFVGDSRGVAKIAGGAYDFVFSCPPYGDLEVYSDDPRDISGFKHFEFLEAYREIIRESTALLKENRFACFVVADFRDPKGFYRNFVSSTIQAFLDAGLGFYNEGILVNAVGSLPVRVGRQFQGGRKLGKEHQNVLVFYKGDPKRIKEIFGRVENE